MNQVILTMGHKNYLFIVIITFLSINSFSEVIYEKQNLIITNIDISKFINLYQNYYGIEIDYNNALKDLVLINNVINHLDKNNKEFLNKIDEVIFTLYNINSLNDANVINFYRFIKIRDEFIINYFKNNLVNNEIENIFEKLENLNLPLSTNDCLLIDKIVDLKDNIEFIDNFLFNLKNNLREFEVTIERNKYKVCIDENNFRDIENLIINYIRTQTDNDFRDFVYDKTKN